MMYTSHYLETVVNNCWRNTMKQNPCNGKSFRQRSLLAYSGVCQLFDFAFTWILDYVLK